MYWISVVLPRVSGSLRRTCVPVMTPVVHVGRAYSQPNQRGIPTTSAAMARTEAALRHKKPMSAKCQSRQQSRRCPAPLVPLHAMPQMPCMRRAESEPYRASSPILRPVRSLQRPPPEPRSEACAQRLEPTAGYYAESAREGDAAA
jgi:hypothetical protein